MILSRFAESEGLKAPHLSTYLCKVGLKCGGANPAQKGDFSGAGRFANYLFTKRVL